MSRDKAPLQVRQENRQSLVIEGLNAALLTGDPQAWTAYPLTKGRILLRASNEEQMEEQPWAGAGEGSQGSFGSLSSEALVDVLRGLSHGAWTGRAAIDTGFGVKSLYFSQGELVFATSNVIDDRLGEVIFRDGLISLDELTQSTAKVSRDIKFGQVLLGSQVFDALDLWQALCLQVRQIVHSVFMVDMVYVEFFPDVASPTEVVFYEGTQAFITACYAFGYMFRGFAGRLFMHSTISLVDSPEDAVGFFPQGTFLGDFIGLVRETSTLEALLQASKVQEPYTLAALMLLRNRGLCTITPMRPYQLPKGRNHILPLKSRMSAYEFVLEEASKAFAGEQKEFPYAALGKLALSLNGQGLPVFFLSQDARIDDQALAHMFNQCVAVNAKVATFVAFIDCLMRFILQVSEDQLSHAAAQRIRETYRNLMPTA